MTVLKEIKQKSAHREYDGANWNENEDNFTQVFYEQNLSQFWRPEDISLQPDLNLWASLSPEIRKAYSQNLAVLTFLDTYQGDIGMPVVSRSLDDRFHQRKAVLNFMAAMENAVHAKSYSNIFMTYLSNEDISDMFSWTENNKNMQRILALIVGYYEDLDRLTYRRRYDIKGAPVTDLEFQAAQWKAMVASVFLESCLFYSGFYYPLYFYGQGKLMQAGEIINLILRDESIHGLYIGNLAMELYAGFDKDMQAELYQWLTTYLDAIYDEEVDLIEEIYDVVDLSHDVKIFVRYNANKAMMNLGFDPYFEHEEVNPVVLNGLNTETKTMDNFSMKGNGYQKMKSESLRDDDFIFDAPKIKR